ncbi:NAD-dependent epimerase/dehydratase family protein [Synechococcus lacustris]|uniref:NAD-dependent epimerase/dehydratase family protein n=1 Tax=Synechococcus lacustris TaxID=2116544 RepID=UPI0020CC4D0A|nr:NAD(P)-dependent oxidoreductase [Synechococcus lacustris]MCP9812656.1 NAD(P)-dependent oxidoreductase [Synechococcus lacustris Maggiore-St4-Slac]
MRVLITGASGFIGRHVLKCLQNSNIDVVLAGRNRPVGYLGDFIKADLLGTTDFNNLSFKANATHLIHLAWYAEHGSYWSSSLNLRWVESTIKLAEAFCEAGGQHIVAAGTCAEYDWNYGYCIEEKTPLIPNTLYGASKDATRRLLMSLCSTDKVTCSWGRIFMPYGPGEDSRRLIPALNNVFSFNQPPFAVGSSSFRDLLHVEDVAAAFVKLLTSGAHGEFNICSGIPTQISEVIKLLANARNQDPGIVLDHSVSRIGEPLMLVGENKKLTSLGWAEKHKLEDLCNYLR